MINPNTKQPINGNTDTIINTGCPANDLYCSNVNVIPFRKYPANADSPSITID
jgi:hypothetical protein